MILRVVPLNWMGAALAMRTAGGDAKGRDYPTGLPRPGRESWAWVMLTPIASPFMA